MTRRSAVRLIWFSLTAVLLSFPLQAEVRLTLDVRAADDGFPRHMSGWIEASAGESNCFYLPYNDVEYGEYNALERRLEIQRNPFQQVSKKQGYIRVNGKTPMVIRLQPGETVAFEATPVRLPDAAGGIWVWEGFHPRRLHRCPQKGEKPQEFLAAGAETYEVSLSTPEGWKYAGLAKPGAPFKFTGAQYGFALVRDVNRAAFRVGGTAVTIFYRSPDFLKLLPTIKQGLQRLPDWYGPFPFSNLTVMEADELDVTGIPGLVLFNKPRQAALESIQTNWLNWSHWVILGLIGRQWLGAHLPLRALEDEWLFRGTIEYTTLRILEETSVRFNIFNSVETGLTAFKFNYRELQDLGAAVLFQDEPGTVLTSKSYDTVLPLDKQHSQVSLRHALALRYAVSQRGVTRSQELLKAAFAAVFPQSMTPGLFASALTQQGERGGGFMADLAKFWQVPGWPDFAITAFDYEKTAAGFRTVVQVAQEGALQLHAHVTITDTSGRQHVVPLRSAQGQDLVAEVKLPLEPAHAEVDAERHVYDSNRYNNTTRWPGLKLFPGNARGVSDDDLTLLWVPYPFRRPGQPWSLALDAALLRYINATTYLTLETEIGGEHRSSFSLSESYKLPSYSLSGAAVAEQNLFGSRVISKQFVYGPLLSTGPRVDLRTAFRHRQIVGKPRSGHQTVGGGLVLGHRGQLRYFGYNLTGEYESAPKAWSPRFQYERRLAVVELLTSIPAWVDYRLRFFRGEYTYDGDVPEELLFNPEDLKLARLRMDVSDLKWSAKIFSVGNDLFLPFSWEQGGGTIMLNRRLRWRLFYDYGRSLDLGEEYRAAGAGLLIPLGGDISGVGTLALTRFNLMVVGYSSAAGEVSRKPRFLFTFGADL